MSKRARHAAKFKKLRPGPDPRPGPGRATTRPKNGPKSFTQKVLVRRRDENGNIVLATETVRWKATQVPVLRRRARARAAAKRARSARKVNR